MDTHARLRALPKVDEVMLHSTVAGLLDANPRSVVVESTRGSIESARKRILAGEELAVTLDQIAADVVARIARESAPSLHPVINATGIIVHTNLGRSVLAPAAAQAAYDIASRYSTLEYDIESGERGSRHTHIEHLICQLTGAEAALAVNNNAAAVMMTIAAFARGKEAIVSRGQLVEIGGSFRVPDIMAESGATMVEIGTTNKTHLADYEKAISERTGLMLKVHSSNYRVVGFTEEVSAHNLVKLSQKTGVAVFEDQGSGVLFDLSRFGLTDEPTVASSIRAGVDVVSCSGDKLLGGPQAGIIAGKADAIARLKKHPMARALRLDKMTLAALETTLRICLDEERAVREIPTLRMLTATQDEMRDRAQSLVAALCATVSEEAAEIAVWDEVSRAGGGSLPLVDIPTAVVAIRPRHMTETELADALRLCPATPIIVRVRDGHVLIDPRTLLGTEEEAFVVSALSSILER